MAYTYAPTRPDRLVLDYETVGNKLDNFRLNLEYIKNNHYDRKITIIAKNILAKLATSSYDEVAVAVETNTDAKRVFSLANVRARPIFADTKILLQNPLAPIRDLDITPFEVALDPKEYITLEQFCENCPKFATLVSGVILNQSTYTYHDYIDTMTDKLAFWYTLSPGETNKYKFHTNAAHKRAADLCTGVSILKDNGIIIKFKPAK